MFKVNDYIRTLYGHVFKLTSIDECSGEEGTETFLFDGEWDCYNDEPVYYSALECSKWEPIADEVCWFWDEGGEATVKRFKEIDRHGYPMPIGCVRGYKYCEPFIGTLPSSWDDYE